MDEKEIKILNCKLINSDVTVTFTVKKGGTMPTTIEFREINYCDGNSDCCPPGSEPFPPENCPARRFIRG